MIRVIVILLLLASTAYGQNPVQAPPEDSKLIDRLNTVGGELIINNNISFPKITLGGKLVLDINSSLPEAYAAYNNIHMIFFHSIFKQGLRVTGKYANSIPDNRKGWLFDEVILFTSLLPSVARPVCGGEGPLFFLGIRDDGTFQLSNPVSRSHTQVCDEKVTWSPERIVIEIGREKWFYENGFLTKQKGMTRKK